jgi:predicted MFS family arabinose efflux permease
MNATSIDTGSTFGVLARQEIRNYLRAKLFWLGAALTFAVDVVMLVSDDPTSSGSYMIAPAALLGVLGLVVMYGLARRSDHAAEAAGAVAVPERTRTLALASATVVPLSVALLSFITAVVAWYVHPPAGYVVPPGISNAFVHAQMFGDGVLCAVGGPLLGLLLARYFPKRGITAVASVLLVIVTILLQGGLIGGEQPYRVFWVWTYFLTQSPEGGPGQHHFTTNPGNPFLWLLYIVTLCVLGVVVAVRHDPESDRATLGKIAIGLVVVAVVLGVLTMTLGFTESVVSPDVCTVC